jgi:anti-anti-sigma regulatory factor
MRAAPLVIDASGVQHFDSSAFAVMLEVARRGAGRGVRITGAPAPMVALAKLYGVDEFVGLRRGVALAQAACRATRPTGMGIAPCPRAPVKTGEML